MIQGRVQILSRALVARVVLNLRLIGVEGKATASAAPI